MNDHFNEAHQLVQNARESLRRGDANAARHFAEQAARLAPKMEDVWLVMAASAANPRDSLTYARRALEINPESERARKGIEWAKGRLNESEKSLSSLPRLNPIGAAVQDKPNPAPRPSSGRGRLYPILFAVLACAVIGFAAWSAVTNPALASIMSSVVEATSTPETLWAPVEMAKPASASVLIETATPTPQDTPLPFDTFTPTPTDTSLPSPTEPVETSTSTPEPTITQPPQPTETPGTLAMEIVVDTPTSVYVRPTRAPAASAPVASQKKYAGGGNGAHWIDVDLSQQRVYAYEGDTVVNSFVVSTGTWLHPTVTGKYHIYIKQLYDNMSGPGYYLKNVPYTMYFFKGYALHGTYWHHNFGTPMSHGCVNLSISDAQWLYSFASVGTTVNVHY